MSLQKALTVIRKCVILVIGVDSDNHPLWVLLSGLSCLYASARVAPRNSSDLPVFTQRERTSFCRIVCRIARRTKKMSFEKVQKVIGKPLDKA